MQFCALSLRGNIWETVSVLDASETITVIDDRVYTGKNLSETGQRTSSVPNPYVKTQYIKNFSKSTSKYYGQKKLR